MSTAALAKRQSDRRADILEAAQRCFVRSGFHQTSMQQICLEAGMSPGNLYRYFPSKEALIAGIAERDRAEFAEDFVPVPSDGDLFAVIERLARQYFVERSDEQIGICIEITAESRRNPEIGRIQRTVDAEVQARLLAMFQQAADAGQIASGVDLKKVVLMLTVIAEGMFTRRSIDPDFDAAALIPLFMDVTRHMLGASTEPVR